MFFTSVFVPSVVVPFGRTETLASHRKLPSSMLPSLTPSAMRISRSFLNASAASPAERRSGSVTISISGVPLRLKSRKVFWSESGNPSWSDLPASSSICTRVMRTTLALPPAPNSSVPAVASGSSYCEI